MGRILVTYATMAGSTAEVAQAVGQEIARSDLQVDVLLIRMLVYQHCPQLQAILTPVCESYPV